MKLRHHSTRALARSWKGAIAALVPLVALVVAASSAAADPPQLTGQRMDSSFYPCAGDDFTPPRLPSECVSPPPTNVTATCDPTGISTITITRTGSAFGAPPLLNGTFTETITATIGPQTGPVRPPIFPFGGPPSESIGFPTGELLGFESTFTIAAGPTTVTGSKSLVANAGNWGVCREFVDEPTGSAVFGGAPLTGHFHIVNAGVLSYEADTSGDAVPDETGEAESYLMSTFATCCSSGSPTEVVSASGHLQQGLGTTHPAAGTSGAEDAVDSGLVEPVTVEPLPSVEVTFKDVTATGEVTATVLTSVPTLPDGFLVGDPPTYYELNTEAGYTGTITICLSYASLPVGVQPRVLHYEDGGWVDVTSTSPSGPPDFRICGEVTSLSPFAVGYTQVYDVAGPFQPVDPQPTVNTMNAGRTVPVKFSLGGNHGLDVFASGYPRSEGGPCGGTSTDSVETTSTEAAGLRYDAASGTYQYNWKTQKAWKGQCRTLILRFDDGQELRADFRFT